MIRNDDEKMTEEDLPAASEMVLLGMIGHLAHKLGMIQDPLLQAGFAFMDKKLNAYVDDERPNIAELDNLLNNFVIQTDRAVMKWSL